MKLTSDIDYNSRILSEQLRASENFDIVKRDICICGKRAFLLFVDGFAKDVIAEKLIEFFISDGA